jgi:hypothetical protein
MRHMAGLSDDRARVDLLAYLYWQRDRDYRQLNKRYREDLRMWAKLEPDETNGDVE